MFYLQEHFLYSIRLSFNETALIKPKIFDFDM
jgi:hypothetical protein